MKLLNHLPFPMWPPLDESRGLSSYFPGPGTSFWLVISNGILR